MLESQMSIASRRGHFDPADSPIGPEKRLELDLRMGVPKNFKDGSEELKEVTFVELVDNVVSAMNVGEVVSRKLVDDATVAIFAADAAIVGINKNRIVITTGSRVQLHLAFAPIVECVAAASMEVEWASYMRKNTVCPWDDNTGGDDMAHEYVQLKKCFPTGKPYMFGPVDADHYLYYVYDNLDRASGTCIENDCQINLKLYGFEKSFLYPDKAQHVLEAAVETLKDVLAMESVSSISSDSVGDSPSVSPRRFSSDGCAFQGCVFPSKGEYLQLRAIEDPSGNIASFETNAQLVDCKDKLVDLVGRVNPERFTLSVLVDPQSTTAAGLVSGHRLIGVEPESFPRYLLCNRVVNEFAAGYKVLKLAYTKNPEFIVAT